MPLLRGIRCSLHGMRRSHPEIEPSPLGTRSTSSDEPMERITLCVRGLELLCLGLGKVHLVLRHRISELIPGPEAASLLSLCKSIHHSSYCDMPVRCFDFGRRSTLSSRFSFDLSCINILSPRCPGHRCRVMEELVEETTHDLHFSRPLLLRTHHLITSLEPQLHGEHQRPRLHALDQSPNGFLLLRHYGC